MKVINWSKVLQELFGDYSSIEMAKEWDTLKSKINKNDNVSGIVVARAPYGIWIDLGFGFPALLESIVVKGMTPAIYKEDKYLPVGSTVYAKISGIREKERQIYLHQDEWPFKINDTLPNT
ncbi:hypothetical protein [Marinicellulosiphila megalodicopiae]|uniref:hypothetical protein n=1 Tax=Marinicellulosiphila megalodicopiae TaxID=2724896 RepID=UPI003BB020B2